MIEKRSWHRSSVLRKQIQMCLLSHVWMPNLSGSNNKVITVSSGTVLPDADYRMTSLNSYKAQEPWEKKRYVDAHDIFAINYFTYSPKLRKCVAFSHSKTQKLIVRFSIPTQLKSATTIMKIKPVQIIASSVLRKCK